MSHYAKGDSGKVFCSSEDGEGDEGYHTRSYISATTIQRISQLNFQDKKYDFSILSGESVSSK